MGTIHFVYDATAGAEVERTTFTDDHLDLEIEREVILSYAAALKSKRYTLAKLEELQNLPFNESVQEGIGKLEALLVTNPWENHQEVSEQPTLCLGTFESNGPAAQVAYDALTTIRFGLQEHSITPGRSLADVLKDGGDLDVDDTVIWYKNRIPLSSDYIVRSGDKIIGYIR